MMTYPRLLEDFESGNLHSLHDPDKDKEEEESNVTDRNRSSFPHSRDLPLKTLEDDSQAKAKRRQTNDNLGPEKN